MTTRYAIYTHVYHSFTSNSPPLHVPAPLISPSYLLRLPIRTNTKSHRIIYDLGRATPALVPQDVEQYEKRKRESYNLFQGLYVVYSMQRYSTPLFTGGGTV